MIVRINGKLVDFVQDKNNGWNTVEVPSLDISRPSMNELIEHTQWVLSSPDAYFQNAVHQIDTVNYYWMSKFEATEFMYRMSKWSVGEVLTTFGVI